MSIIYDALKKVEKKKTPFSGSKDSSLGGSTTFNYISRRARQKLSSRKTNKIPILISLLIILALVFVLALSRKNQPAYYTYIPAEPDVIEFIKKREVKNSRPLISDQKARQAQADVLKAAQAKPNTSLPYSLEGIVYDGKESFAIINGVMVKEKDMFGQEVVIEITEDQVKLFNPKDNTKTVLTLSF